MDYKCLQQLQPFKHQKNYKLQIYQRNFHLILTSKIFLNFGTEDIIATINVTISILSI